VCMWVGAIDEKGQRCAYRRKAGVLEPVPSLVRFAFNHSRFFYFFFDNR
jgi:hypothetical protein